MIISLLASVIISAASSITVGGLEVTENNHIWTSVVTDFSTAEGALEVYETSDASKGFGTSVLTIAPEGKSVIGGALKSDRKGNIMLFYTLTEGYYDGKGDIYMQQCSF